MNLDSLLVSTKFAPPRIGARFIVRKQLLEQLRSMQRCTFTLVTGSPGFGKTTLMAQWRQELMKSGAVVAWLSLSHDDRVLTSFCAYLVSALRRLGIALDEDEMLEGNNTKALDSLVASAVNGASQVAKELYLILDDYHHVEDASAHRLMQKLIDHCPANLHIAIASRMAPPFSISRLRVLGQVADISFEELPFDLDETRLFFEQNLHNVKLSADELRLIHDLTNGWPASLQLLAIMLKNRPSTRHKLRELGWQSSDLQAYLANDVVAHLPAELNDFIEQVSVCRRFNAELAEAITGRPDAAELIKRIEDENLLIYRVESEDRLPWYRFHPLFSDFLATCLARRGQPAIEMLHRRASQWFGAHDLLIEAVRHATLGGDLEFAVKAIEQAAPAEWRLGYVSPLLSLLDRLPQETLFLHPRLFFLGCLTFAITARPEKAERWLAQIRQSEVVRNPAISSHLALADAAVAMQRDDTQRAVDLLEPVAVPPDQNRFLHYVFLATLSSAYCSVGRYADAHRLLDAHPVAAEDRRNDMALVVEGARIYVYLVEGNVREAARAGSLLLSRAMAAHGRRSVSANLAAGALGEAYYELDRIDDAREVLANRPGILQSSMPGVMASAALARARLDLLQGSPDVALEFLESQAAHFHSLGHDRPLAWMLGEQVRILLAKGERIRASDLVTRLKDLASQHRDALGYRAEIPVAAALARARLLLHVDRPAEAIEALAEVRAHAQHYGRGRLAALAALLMAMALEDLGRHQDAQAQLVEAVQAGARFGFVRTFVDEGEHVGAMLARLPGQALSDPLAARYLEDLLGRFGGAGARAAPADEGVSEPAVPRKEDVNLTPRELEILSLISQAMSNKRIALTLSITLETVKWNVKNILAKLGVSSRYDAMTWARKRGLIE
ncbi:LuxR C-terminal-related transcriptional regulator [Variovorax humicola]|uniref:LuxR C-terminal-related transcriptional regulator n=1 Tax=Variovorax humicola TaxID=1769758 RepID=A0ABU8VXR1_9BURK